MNLELYDIDNTRFLARQEWMMTCTDGRTPAPGVEITHPRVYGAFTRKLRQFVFDEGIISMSFSVRSMSGLAADFLQITDRGYLREGMGADIVVLDKGRIRDMATLDDPQSLLGGHGACASQWRLCPTQRQRHRGPGRACTNTRVTTIHPAPLRLGRYTLRQWLHLSAYGMSTTPK